MPYPFLRACCLMVLLLVAVACSRKITTSVTTEVTDSTYVREIVRVDTFNIPGDSVTITKYLECDPVTNKVKPFSISKKSKQASAIFTVLPNGEAIVDAKCDSLQRVIEAMDREIFHLRHVKELRSDVKEVNKPTAFDYFCRGVTILLIAAVVIFVTIKSMKP